MISTIILIRYLSMGSFRSQPDLEKHTVNKSGNGFTYSVTHMCGTVDIYTGWRIYMEDAHIDAPNFGTDKKNSLFGVFDGHGGTHYSI
jgi:hypothetical protein